MSLIPAESHYQHALAYLRQRDWAAAEGCLWKAQALLAHDAFAASLSAVLAYALLMQAEIREAMWVLQPWLNDPRRTFWIHHFYAEALRALNLCSEAVPHYRQALGDGSTFSGTSCQLLLALHRICPALALDQVQAWPWPLEEHLLEGIREAAGLSAGLELAEWLERCELASEELEYRLACQRLYGLTPMATACPTESLAVVRHRLHQLGLAQLA